jgi:beta-glucosidase
MSNKYPKDFLWGTATSSYQIEGAFDEDGRSESIWDRFAKTPGKVMNGDTGDIAADHYHRFKEDVAIMRELGIEGYRFSLAWPRLLPDGTGKIEPRGFDFYNRLIDELLENGIEPLITAYHWDLPQVLQDQGGWANRNIVDQFENYSHHIATAFGDRVKDWITINEPWCVSWLGYMSGIHAPGIKNRKEAVAAAHHTALAHAASTRVIKELVPNSKVGITLNMTNVRVLGEANSDTAKVERLMDANLNRWWIDAYLTGNYPAELIEYYGDLVDGVILPGDSELLIAKPDFMGINYYSDAFIGNAQPGDKPLSDGGPYPFDIAVNQAPPANTVVTDFGWPITPLGLADLLVRVHQDWPEIPSLCITENGAAFNDGPDENGEVNDERRVQYLKGHLEAIEVALSKGVPLTGYFAWSLLDNFEWAEGYDKRFGLVHVDFETQKRTMKKSAYVFRDHIHLNS